MGWCSLELTDDGSGGAPKEVSEIQMLTTVEPRMKILVFTEGTTIRWTLKIPSGNAAEKLQTWKRQGAKIAYLTSRTKPDEIETVRNLLGQYGFPQGELFYRHEGEEYKDVAERIMPHFLIEDDCESIGGEAEMTYPHVKPELKQKIKSIVVSEGGGIDHLPDNLFDLARY